MAGFRRVRISWATVSSRRSEGAPLVLDFWPSYSITPCSSPCHGAIVMPCALTVTADPSDTMARRRAAACPGARTSPGNVTAGTGGEADAPGGAAVVAGPAGLPARHRVVSDRLRRRPDRARVAGVARVADPVDP